MTNDSTLQHKQPDPVLYAFSTKDELCERLAEYVIKLQNAAIERRGKFLLAVSGGSLPSMLAKNLVNRQDNAVRWDKWYVVVECDSLADTTAGMCFSLMNVSFLWTTRSQTTSCAMMNSFQRCPNSRGAKFTRSIHRSCTMPKSSRMSTRSSSFMHLQGRTRCATLSLMWFS